MHHVPRSQEFIVQKKRFSRSVLRVLNAIWTKRKREANVRITTVIARYPPVQDSHISNNRLCNALQGGIETCHANCSCQRSGPLLRGYRFWGPIGFVCPRAGLGYAVVSGAGRSEEHTSELQS